MAAMSSAEKAHLTKMRQEKAQYTLKTHLRNANDFSHHGTKGADQLPFSATGLIHFKLAPDFKKVKFCVGSVIHNVDYAGSPTSDPFRATYVLTAGHCCYSKIIKRGRERPVKNGVFKFSWSANSRMPWKNIVWDLEQHYDLPSLWTGLSRDDKDAGNDWCVIGFTEGPSIGQAPAVLHIKYDDGNPVPSEGKLLMSTYWTNTMIPPNPQQDDILKKFAEIAVTNDPIKSERFKETGIPTKKDLKETYEGVWKLKKEYTAKGLSGCPFVETGHPNLIRGTLQGGEITDYIVRIDQQEFNDIRRVINRHIRRAGGAGARPLMGVNPEGTAAGVSTIEGVSASGVSAAHHLTSDILSPYFMDKDSEENRNGYGLDYDHHHRHDGTGHIDDGSMELVTNRYYYQYGEHGQNHIYSYNIYSFAMGVMMTIGICCFVMIISIIINLCTCVANIYYTQTNNRHSKHGGNRYNIVNNDVDGDQV